MRSTLVAILDSPQALRAASVVTLALGYFFIFVWAPHPWSWQGIDSYHELAKSLARGEPFQTTDVPWGYAYYAALFYKLFGDRIWVPLVVQATLNATVPFMLYRLVAPLAGRRVATLSALIVGVFSFNTVYASTQSSDTICTVIFLAALLLFARGVREQSVWTFVGSGILLGVVPQFRPNMVVFPGLMVFAYLVAPPRTRNKVIQMAAFTVMVIALQMPWIVRNYRLTGLILPTSTHGGVQLWYGTLQVGEHLESRAHNPRFYFASPAFTYTSLWTRPIVISAVHRNCGAPEPTRLLYWTDRDVTHRAVAAAQDAARPNVDTFTLPPQPNDSTLYYYFAQANTSTPGGPDFTTPVGGPANPSVAFVSDNHLGDLDRHDDVIDMFDLVRMLRHIAWGEPLQAEPKLDLTGDGTVDAADVEASIRLLLPDLAKAPPTAPLSAVVPSASAVELKLVDGSWISVPREFGGKQTDVGISLDGQMAPALLSRSRTFTSITPPVPTGTAACMPADEVIFNGPFYLGEPHMMQRFMALAMDNINRDPWAFARASLYRMMRLFIVRGTDDVSTSQQFRGSKLVYVVGTTLSIGYLVVFAAGVVIAWRRRSALLLFLLPIVYVPLTICFVLTNMRYTVTMQPLMFAFVALAIATALRVDAPNGAGGDYRVRVRT
jgi:4-amino-4-deoxy-L-arabinose transferase-like glycosyltransferase